MPRYFFDTIDGKEHIDQDGELLADDAAACVVAYRVASEVMHAHVRDALDGDKLCVVARNGAGEVARVTVSMIRRSA